MRAITSRYFGPTNHSLARIIVNDRAGNLRRYVFDYEKSDSSNHQEAVRRFIKELGWDQHYYYGGELHNYGYVWVCAHGLVQV